MTLSNPSHRRIVREAFEGGLICALGAAMQVIVRVYGPIWELTDPPSIWLPIKEAIIVMTGLVLGAITGAACQTWREMHRATGKNWFSWGRKGAAKNDRRLRGQELYLKKATLCWRMYESWSKNWDHDTCAFCGRMFTQRNDPGTLHEGYAAPDGYHWVCKECFDDFATMFEFNVISQEATSSAGPLT